MGTDARMGLVLNIVAGIIGGLIGGFCSAVSVWMWPVADCCSRF